MALSYSDIGLTSMLRSENALTERGDSLTSTLNFDSQYERGVINTTQIRDGAVNTIKIEDAAITTAKIGTAQITTALIGSAQITSAKINDFSFNQGTGGTIGVLTLLGGANIEIDGVNSRIVINVGTVDRIYLGSF